MDLPPPFQAYVASWSTACLAATVTACLDGRRLIRDAAPYAGFLLVPWKLATFAPAFLFVTFAGRFAYDDTWDTVTGGGMSLLTFATAPWAVGAAWLGASGHRPRRDIALAAVACLFSASWSYDGYLLWRDGSYGGLWLPNLLVSPVLYMAAGLMWNLEAAPDGKATFAFLQPGWPGRGTPGTGLAWLAWTLPFVVSAAAVLLGSVRWRPWP